MHPNFRIFLSAVPTDDFPISLLQRALKLTQEPPRGIKMNMTRLYKNMDKEFIDCDQD
jgi:dynein heavy chain